MKKVALLVSIFIFSFILGSVFSFAQKGNDFGRHPFSRFADELGLTDQQKEQIEQILKAEREKMMTLKEEMRQIHKQLSAQGKDGVFNEALVTELAAKQAELTKQMIIEKERTKASLFAVLTPEQREKAEQLKTDFKGRFRDKFKDRWGKFE
jgi:protein CpxP